jgi:hypothetical protein
MLGSRTISISINRSWKEICAGIWRPEDFPKWASGLSELPLVRDGEAWTAEGPEGPIGIRFTGHNEFGVMDHWIDVSGGQEIYVPLRVLANGDGAEVMLTLFRQPGMSDEKFAADAAWVQRDLVALRELVTRGE